MNSKPGRPIAGQSRYFHRRLSLGVTWALVAFFVVIGDVSIHAQAANQAATDAQAASASGEVTVGIEGHYRVGYWTAVRVSGVSGNDDNRSAIETRDGDGVRVIYEQAAPLSQGVWGYAIAGSEAAPLIVRGESEILLSTRFPEAGRPAQGPSMIPLKMPWIVSIGDPLGVDKIGANKLLNRDARVTVSQPGTADGLPDSVLGYEGVDLIMIGGSGRDILADLSQLQQTAISQWVLNGGRLFVTLGASGPELLRSAPWLSELLPLSDQPATTVKLNPSAIEVFTSSQTPLSEFEGLRLPKQVGRDLIIGRTTRRVSTPMAVEYNVALGRITVLTADLESEVFAEWPDRLDLITRLTGSILLSDPEESSNQTRATAYDDLAGQTRLTLDQFPVKRTFAFSVVSLILMGLIAAIGPLDYFLINRFLGRPLLGWLSFPVMAIGLSVILAQQASPVVAGVDRAPSTNSTNVSQANADSQNENAAGSTSNPDTALGCNRLEFIDVDARAGVGRGFSLSYLYSHRAALIDLDVVKTPTLDLISSGIDRMLTSPYGYPGESFGGIQIAIEDARLPTYRVTHQSEIDQRIGSLQGLPLAPRSSKAVATQFSFAPKLAVDVTVQRRPGSQLLQGSLANPLPFDLLGGMLVYRNSAYLLPTRFPVGDEVADLETLRQRNFRWRLSRQKVLEENQTETQPWDPADDESPQRIAEMLMFHDAVGGSRYTSLRNDLLTFLDLTHVLSEDQCMLVGRVATPVTQLSLESDEFPKQTPAGERLTYVRVVLPIKVGKR